MSTATIPNSIPAQGIDLGPGRRRVTQRDVDLYQALVFGGEVQSVEQMEAVAEKKRAQPVATPLAIVRPARKPFKDWTPTVMCIHLAGYCYHGITSVRVRRPEIAHWVRRFSDEAKHKLTQARARLSSPRWRHM
jgi:hypothetical protein